MMWFLILWSSIHSPFEGGQYQTKAGCEIAGPIQVHALRSQYGRLKWACRQGDSFEEIVKWD